MKSTLEPQSYFEVRRKAVDEAVDLLKQLVSTPSVSRQEGCTADLLEHYFANKHIPVQRVKNNIIVRNKWFSSCNPVVVLNSHHDTVQPGESWTMDPFKPAIKDGRLFGLGSNDAGGPLVSLILTFLAFYEMGNLPFDLVLVASAEEEVSGADGVELALKEIPRIDFAIVGEPTGMKMATAEKGLVVLDCIASGKAGHAARSEGENAIYMAMKDIEWFRTYCFEKKSGKLGDVKMTVTQIQAGSQHNVVPATCDFVVDIRNTDVYTNEEVVELIGKQITSKVRPRSTRLQPSGLSENHELVKVAKSLGLETYGSPTLSDMALMSFPTVKIGPGESARSHTADEYIELEKIESGIDVYISLLGKLMELRIESDKSGK